MKIRFGTRCAKDTDLFSRIDPDGLRTIRAMKAENMLRQAFSERATTSQYPACELSLSLLSLHSPSFKYLPIDLYMDQEAQAGIRAAGGGSKMARTSFKCTRRFCQYLIGHYRYNQSK